MPECDFLIIPKEPVEERLTATPHYRKPEVASCVTRWIATYGFLIT
jgi:hypothetical protein